jgi:dipeptidyl aminopeptidase/acylaminoacyl peptidase
VSDGGAFAALRTDYPDDPTLADELFRSARVLAVLLLLLFFGGIALLRSESTSGTVAVTQGGAGQATTTTTGATTAESTPEEDTVTVEEVPLEGSPTTVAPRGPASAPPLPKLVFVRVYDPTRRDLVVRDPGARGNELRLRADGAVESRPRLSPDGAHVAFIRERDSAWKVCVIAATGGESVCVADTTSNAAVAWGRDGNSLVFSRGGGLFSISYDTTTQTAGTEVDLGVAAPDGQFGLSPDGSRVVVVDGRRLAVRPVDGSAGLTIDVSSPPLDPSFSPDGGRIVYAANLQIFTVPANGGTVRQLTSAGSVNGEPAWTGDGDWVVFRSNRSGSGDLYAVKGGGGNGEEQGLAQVTNTVEREVMPSF